MTLKVQTAGCDDAKQGLQWRKRHRCLRSLGQAWALTTLHIRFVLRGNTVAVVSSHTLAQARCVLWQIQDVGVTTLAWHRVALRQGHGCSCTSGGSGKRAADEVTTTGFALGNDGTDTVTI